MSKEIVKACVKYNDRLYTGFEHGECFNKLNDDNKIIVFDKIEQGFVDSDGSFVDRKQAMVIARENGQLSYETDKKTLISEDLHLDWLKKQDQKIKDLEHTDYPTALSQSLNRVISVMELLILLHIQMCSLLK